MALPRVDRGAVALRKLLGEECGYAVTRFKNIWVDRAVVKGLRAFPRAGRALIRRENIKRLPKGFDVAVFGAAVVGGLFLRQFHGADLHTDRAAFSVAVFYVVVNLLTTVFLGYFAKRLWNAGAKWPAIWTGLVTAAGTTIALTYDFFPLPFDDANRTIFYIAALATWGTQGFVYFHAYRALHDHNASLDATPGPCDRAP
jgi:fluoride ion exporter CrcB/FEX